LNHAYGHFDEQGEAVKDEWRSLEYDDFGELKLPRSE
jgi:hypothetical protein